MTLHAIVARANDMRCWEHDGLACLVSVLPFSRRSLISKPRVKSIEELAIWGDFGNGAANHSCTCSIAISLQYFRPLQKEPWTRSNVEYLSFDRARHVWKKSRKNIVDQRHSARGSAWVSLILTFKNELLVPLLLEARLMLLLQETGLVTLLNLHQPETPMKATQLRMDRECVRKRRCSCQTADGLGLTSRQEPRKQENQLQCLYALADLSTRNAQEGISIKSVVVTGALSILAHGLTGASKTN